MTYFLQEVASYLYQKNKGNFRDTVIIFPGRRARLFFNHFLSQMADKPLWAPKYYTISDFVQQLSGLQLADPLSLLFRLYTIFRKITSSKETFDNFYYYCEVILADFDDIDKYRIDADALYTNLSDLKTLEDYKEYLEDFQIDTIRNFWDILIKSRESDEKDQFLSVWEALSSMYTEFGNSLEKEGLAYEGRIYRRAIDRLLSGQEHELFDHEVVFVGFNALNHSEEILFDRFQTRGNTLFFWDYDESYIKSDLHEAGFFLKKYIIRYPQPTDFISGQHTDIREQKITTVAVPSTVSQAKIIDKCLEISGSGKVKSPLQTALILADETLLMPVVNSLPGAIEDVNISMGYPVIDTPAYSFITSLTDLQRNRRKSGNRIEYYYQNVFSVLKHATLNHFIDREEAESFQKKCQQKNRIFIWSGDITVQGDMIDLIFHPLEEPVQFGQYLRKIIEIIATKESSEAGDMDNKWQLEILFAIHKVLMRFEVLVQESGIEFTFSTLLNLLRKILQGTTVPFEGEPLTGLQVMGILETRTLDFENVVILSMNEGVFPKSEHIPSLIPFSLREGFRLPTINHQDAIFGYYFYRLLHRSKNVVLVYNTRTEGLLKGEPSRFLLQLKYERSVPPVHLDMGYEAGPHFTRRITVNKNENVFEALKKYQIRESDYIISPSALNNYIVCSLRFYYKYIEEIEEPEEIKERIEADMFGRILHKAMSVLYKPFYNKDCQAKDIESVRSDKKKVKNAIKQAFAEEYFQKKEIDDDDFHGMNLIIWNVIEQYIGGILAYDIQSVPFTILSTEEKYFTLIRPENSSMEVRVGGYIDRLDRKDGIVRIIDYKTGKRDSTFSSVESLFSSKDERRNGAVFQTFLYSWILSKENPGSTIQPLLYYIRDIYQPNYSPEIFQSENRKKIRVENFDNYMEGFGKHITGLINEIFDANVPFSQTDDLEHCKRCPYNEICLRETD